MKTKKYMLNLLRGEIQLPESGDLTKYEYAIKRLQDELSLHQRINEVRYELIEKLRDKCTKCDEEFDEYDEKIRKL